MLEVYWEYVLVNRCCAEYLVLACVAKLPGIGVALTQHHDIQRLRRGPLHILVITSAQGK